MCGIFALLNNHQSYNYEEVQKAFDKGQRRGPDNSILCKNGDLLVMGFHRLSINGLDSNSGQPLTIENVTLICNGEIYNYKELFSELNITPITNSDCEIIIHLYRRYGIDQTLRLLDGVFSFVLYDITNLTDGPTIHVARDPFGVRPLYILSSRQTEYTDINSNDQIIYDNIIAFASEAKVLQKLLNIDDNLETDTYYNNKRPHSLRRFLNDDTDFHIQTKLKISQFQPGTYSSYFKKSHACSSWELRDQNKCYFDTVHTSIIYCSNWSPEEGMGYKLNLWRFLNDAVRKRVVGTTDRPIACLLSGGLDSSLITALVKKYYDKELETYSIGMAGSDDLRYAKIVAQHLGTKHTEVILTPQEFWDAIPEVIEAIESYDTTTVRASVGNYLIGKYISKHSEAKVIFNGDGSDELTGGYLYFLKAPDSFEFDKECRRLLKDIHCFDVLRSDKSISSNGLETRTPFLDKTLVQMYLNIPVRLRDPRYNGKRDMEKFFLRNTVESMDPNLLPSEILWRTKEAFSDGVSGNAGSWFEIIAEKVKAISFNGMILEDVNLPSTKEQQYYRSIFDKCYPKSAKLLPYFWMPKYVNATDSSARTLDVYKEECKD